MNMQTLLETKRTNYVIDYVAERGYVVKRVFSNLRTYDEELAVLVHFCAKRRQAEVAAANLNWPKIGLTWGIGTVGARFRRFYFDIYRAWPGKFGLGLFHTDGMRTKVWRKLPDFSVLNIEHRGAPVKGKVLLRWARRTGARINWWKAQCYGETSRLRFGFRGKDQSPLLMIWREYWYRDAIHYAEVLFKL